MKIRRYRDQVGQLLDARVRVRGILPMDVSLEEFLWSQVCRRGPLELRGRTLLTIDTDFADWRGETCECACSNCSGCTG